MLLLLAISKYRKAHKELIKNSTLNRKEKGANLRFVGSTIIVGLLSVLCLVFIIKIQFS